MWSIFKTEMLIYESKVNFGEKAFLARAFIFKTQNLKNLCKGYVWNDKSNFYSGP